MKKRTCRYIAWLCVFCMLLTSMPYSVLSDSAPATPTDLQPARTEITQESGTDNTGEPAAEETGNTEPDPATEEPVPEKQADPENPAETEKPRANKDLKTGNDLTVNGKLEKKEYLIRFTPAETQTAYLILSSGKQLEAEVTAEGTGITVPFVREGTDEDGRNVWTAAEYKTEKDHAYLVRITGAESTEFTLRIVKKSILTREREAENTEGTAEAPEEKLKEETGEDPDEQPENPAGEEVPEENTEEESGEETDTPAEEPEDEPGTEPDGGTVTEPEENTGEEVPEEETDETEEGTGEETGTPAEEPEIEPGAEPDGETVTEPEENTGEETEEQTGEEDPEENPAEKKEETGEELPEEQSDEETGKESGETTEEKTGTEPETVLQPADGAAADEEPADPEAGELLTEAEPEVPTEVRLDAAEPETEAWISFLSDAGIPPETELHVRELSAEAAEACRDWLAKALKCEDESCLRYTKYIELTLTLNGEELELNTPVNVFVRLPDAEEGTESLQVVRFDGAEAVLLDSSRMDGAICFGTYVPGVFGIGNALTTLTAGETELARVEVLGYASGAPVNLTQTADPEVAEGLEVLGAFAIGSQEETAETAERREPLWIRAELKKDAKLDPTEGVALYRVKDGQADVMTEELTEEGRIMKLDAGQIALIRDTGLRRRTLTVNPEGKAEEQTITLDGLVPKAAEATAEDVTERFAGYVFPRFPQRNLLKARKAAPQTEKPAEWVTLAAFDISITDENGEYQPDEGKPIRVEIIDSRITPDRETELWHIRDDGTEEKIENITVEEGRIVFEAAGFSVYVVVVHEDGTVANPRVEFHFISRDDNALISGNRVYYASAPYPFRNKDGQNQTTQILKDGEALELITDPGNLEDKHFYGWYVVNPYIINGTTDEHGIGTEDSKLYYSWPANPDAIVFEKPISIEEHNVSIGDTVHWSLHGISGAGAVDRDGSVHVFLAPVYDKYNFINFMLYARDAGVSGASNLMTRKLIAEGSAPGVDVKISDIRSSSTDAVHLIFIGWEYNAGTEANPDWTQIPTVDYTGAELKDSGRDGVYFTAEGLAEGESIDLYPIFVEARWVDFVSGVSGSGATFVGSRFLESWGRNGVTPDGMTQEPDVNVFDPSIPVSQRQGYLFDGWYAFASTDPNTGEITNLTEPKDVPVSYIDENLQERLAMINTTAKKITDGNGRIIYNGKYTLDVGSGYDLFEGSGTSLKFYDALDRLTLYANWIPDHSGITVVYWTENADDDGYASSAVKTISTTELNNQLNTAYASGSEITLEGLQAYTVDSVSVLSTGFLDDVSAVPAGEEIFYDLNAEKSDQSKIIDGEGSAIFNVYYSRKVFKLVFHIGRDGYVKLGGAQKTTAGWDGNWIEYMFNDDKVRALGYQIDDSNHKGKSGPGLYSMTYQGRTYTSEYVTNNSNVMGDYVPGADENVYVLAAKYGAYIGDRWPTPSNPNFVFSEPANSRYTMYTWAGYYGSLYCRIANERPTWGGQQGNNPDLNGIYRYMSAELCSNRAGTGIINQNQVHHIVAYFGEKSNQDRFKQYHTMYEAVEGTYDPASVTLVPGENYTGYARTTWSSDIAHVSSVVIADKMFYEAAGSPVTVISNVNPEFQMAWELDGYEYFYSCYNVPTTHDNHVYFFYTPKQYTLTFMYENEADRKMDAYFYKQSLADAKKYEDPWKEGYRFLGWYTNEAGAGDPFDFTNSTMPAQSLVLYPVFKKLDYVIRIDPNGAEIDRWRAGSTSAGASTGFRVNYKETISAYNFLERNYLPTYEQEIRELGLNPETELYYYLNTRYISEEHDGDFIPGALRSALYLTAAEIDQYWAYYSSFPEERFTERGAVKFTNKEEWMDAYLGGHNLDNLTKYRRKQGAEHYSFMGWYQVMEDGSLASAPFNFNTMITEDLEIRALWRLDGGYYIRYNPTYTEDDGQGNVTTVMGDVEQWSDPEDPSRLLYADQSPTHILRAPSNITPGWVFRGWRVVRLNGETWEPIQLDENGEAVYYQPGSDFIIDSSLVSEIAGNGAVIHMQAYYEPDDTSYRRPDVTSLILDANDSRGGYVNTADSTGLPALDHPGHTWINTEDHLDGGGRPTQILFGDTDELLQSNLALHLYRYATEQTHDGVQGTSYFSNDGFCLLLGFDENEDPFNPTTGSPYIPAFAADAAAAVTREGQETLYAMWEPMIYVTFVNTTEQPITVHCTGTAGTETVRVVNMVTGEYDREETRGTIIVPAKTGDTDGRIKVVLPCAEAGTDVLTAEVWNDHARRKLSVSGTFNDEPCGTGMEDIPYGNTVIWSGTLQFDREGIVVTYTEKPDNQMIFNVNGGEWTETSEDYIHLHDDVYTIYEARIEDNAYRPADPTHSDRIFIGWTTNADIAAHTDFSSEEAVTWGGTTITPDAGSIVLDKIREQYLWDFSQPPPYEEILYAVWSEKVTVTYDMIYTSNTKLHTWNGPETVNTDELYTFFRSNENQRLITWSMAKGERALKPEDPSPHSDKPAWNFITWLEQNSTTDSYRNSAKEAGTDTIVHYAFDFSQRVMASVTLITSWTTTIPQHYTFTVEKRVVDGNPNDEFTFNIEVLDELVNGKITTGSNTVGPPAQRWGSVAVKLKNNQQYTVNMTVSYINVWGGVYGIGIDVVDENGTVIKSGQVIYCEQNKYKNFVSDYKYTLRISEEAAAGYETAITAEDVNGSFTYSLDQEERAFTFRSCKKTNSDVQASFTPQENTYTAGADCSLRLVFTNTGEPIIAPTGVRTGTAPFVLMMLAGLLLAAGIILPGRMRKYRQGKAAQAEETDGKQGDPVG